MKTYSKVKLSLYRQTGIQQAGAPRISRQSAHKGGKIVSPTHRPPLPPGKIPRTHFCLRLSRPQSHGATEGIKSTKNPTDFTGNRTRDLPACRKRMYILTIR